MTPFSVKLRALRESHGLLQKTLAIELGVGTTYLSALEQGRKSPPRNDIFFEKLKNCIDLSDQQVDDLRKLAEATDVLGTLVEGASSFQVEVALNFASQLKSTQPDELRIIQAVLDMSKQRSKLAAI